MDRKAYLKKLESEHLVIKGILGELEPRITSRRVDGIVLLRGTLDRLEKALSQHAESEDNFFYMDMRDKAVELGQDAMLPALDYSMDAMQEVTRKGIAFFARYRNNDSIIKDSESFFSSLEDLKNDLLKRISCEEVSLYSIYRTYFSL